MSKRKFITTAIVLVIATVADIYWTWTHKEPLCQKESCTNFDPINRRCDRDAKTIAEEKFEETTIKLRYSAKCDAGWPQAKVPPHSFFYLENSKGIQYSRWEVPDDKIAGPHFGNMAPGRNVKACVQLPDNKHLCTKLASEK